MSITVRQVIDKLLDYDPDVVCGVRVGPGADGPALHADSVVRVGNCPVLCAFKDDLTILDVRAPDPLPWDVVEDMKEAIIMAQGYIGSIPNDPPGLKAYVMLTRIMDRLKALTKE